MEWTGSCLGPYDGRVLWRYMGQAIDIRVGNSLQEHVLLDGCSVSRMVMLQSKGGGLK
jgi:hypothetical protein